MDIQEELKRAHKTVTGNMGFYEDNKSYVEGKNWPILTQGEQKEPDNRVPVAFAKLFVNTLSGYAGSNTKVMYPMIDKTNDEQEVSEYEQQLKDFQDYNDDDTLLSELYKEIISQEKAYLLFWVSDEKKYPDAIMTPEYAMIPCNRGIMLYDDSIKPKKMAFVLFTEEYKGDTKKTYADVYYPGKLEVANGVEVRINGHSEGYVSRDNEQFTRVEDRDTLYPYTSVPAIEFKMSKDGGPVFEAEKPMMDQIDKVISRSNNELERFANVTLLLPEKMDKDFADKFRTSVLTMLDDLAHLNGDQWPKYLEKNLSGVSEYQNNLLITMKDYTFKTGGIPDFTDERFAGGDESGVARAFKLISLEYLASSIEIYLKKALYERKALFDDVINASTNSTLKTEAPLHTTEVFTERNLPMDMAAKATIATMLKGIVSDKTIFERILSGIIEDPKDEMERLEKQAENEPELIIDEDDDIGFNEG